MDKKIIYFICTGNSCRSQMAEGFGKKYGEGEFEIYSAGVEAHGLNPRAVEIMKEAGIDISNHKSEIIDAELLNNSTYAITLCGDAEERCPYTPPHVKRLHWGLEDPAKATGTEEEIMATFRKVRDQVDKLVYNIIQEIKTSEKED